MEKITGGVTAAKGFMAAGAEAGIKYKNRKDMAMIYSCLLYTSVPAITFARSASGNVAPIHCRYDVKEVMSMEQLQKDIDFIAAFTDRMANAAVCPVSRTMPEDMKKQLDEYLNRKRKED